MSQLLFARIAAGNRNASRLAEGVLGGIDIRKQREVEAAREALATGRPYQEPRGILRTIQDSMGTPGINPNAPDPRVAPQGLGGNREALGVLAKHSPGEYRAHMGDQRAQSVATAQAQRAQIDALNKALDGYAPEMVRHGEVMKGMDPAARSDYFARNVAPGLQSVGLGQLAQGVMADGVIDDADVAAMISRGAARGGRPDPARESRPSSVEEYEYLMGLSEADRQVYLDLKRQRPQVPDSVLQAILKASDEAQSGFSTASRYEALADQFSTTEMPAGVKGSMSEMFKRITGTEDGVSELRRSYAGIRAAEVVSNLPPGAASDKDIEMAMSGFPAENANAETIASFLRGVAKVQRLQAEYDQFKADYLSRNESPVGIRRAWAEHAATLDTDSQQRDPYGLGL